MPMSMRESPADAIRRSTFCSPSSCSALQWKVATTGTSAKRSAWRPGPGRWARARARGRTGWRPRYSRVARGRDEEADPRDGAVGPHRDHVARPPSPSQSGGTAPLAGPTTRASTPCEASAAARLRACRLTPPSCERSYGETMQTRTARPQAVPVGGARGARATVRAPRAGSGGSRRSRPSAVAPAPTAMAAQSRLEQRGRRVAPAGRRATRSANMSRTARCGRSSPKVGQATPSPSPRARA